MFLKFAQRPQPLQTVFICGCGHSGTTLLANMFASHPDIFIPLRETNAFVKSYGNNPQPRPLKEARSRYKKLLRSFRTSKRTFLFEKTPSGIL